MHARRLRRPAKAARGEPLGGAGRPAALKLEAVLAERVAQVQVRDLEPLERRVVDVRVLLVRRARVVGGADEARRRRREARAAEKVLLAGVEGGGALGDLPLPLVEEAVVLRLPVLAIDPRVHEHLRVERLALPSARRAQQAAR